jgi:hypothetical protein
VAREVTPIVQQNVGENVTRQVVAESKALIEENVNRSVDTRIEAKVEEKIEAKIAPVHAIRDEVKLLTTEVARMQPAVAANARAVAQFRTQIARLPEREVPQIESPSERQLAAIRAQMEKQQNTLVDIVQRLEVIEKRLRIE